ncbi:MAG: FtsX-like permease family protein [Chloroflexota bacterium]
MSVIWSKVWFDLWNRKARTILAVLSIAAGVFAIGAIFGMVDQLLTGMDSAHHAVEPSHMNIILTNFIDEETAQDWLKIPGVVGVEPLNINSVRYKLSPDAPWENGTVVMRDDFDEQIYDFVSLRDGAWPDNYNIGIERLSSAFYGLEMGDTVIFELDGTDRPFTINGKIRHPFVPPPNFGGQAYFFVDEDTMARLAVPVGVFNQVLVRVEPYSEDYARDRAAEIKERLAKQDIGVFLTIYQDPEEHWGRPFIAGITLVLQILAIISLLTSVILVVNTMTAIITQQTDQIGVIKAIGGTSDIIVRVYLAGVLIYGLLGLFIALPLGMMGAFGTTQVLLNLFNIDYEIFQFSTRAVVLQLLAAIVAPLLAALWPVLSGAAISVREAIASYGLGGDFGSSRFDQWIERVSERFLSSAYAMSLGNVFRRKGRLWLTQGVLITAGTMFLMVMTLANSVNFTLENEFARRAYDIRLRLLGQQRADRMTSLALRVPGVEAIETRYTVPTTVLREGEQVKDTAGLGGELVTIPVGEEMYRPLITGGRWLESSDTGNVIVISRDTADFNDVAVGDTLTLDLGVFGDDDWVVVGIYQALTADPISTDPIYAPKEAVFAATKQANQTIEVLVTTTEKDFDSTLALKQELIDVFQTRNIDTDNFVSRTKPEDRLFAQNQFGIITSMLLGLAVVMGVVGGIGLMGSLSISVVERTREIGVLRAIGAKSPTIMSMFVMEGVLQGLLSWFVAVPLAFFSARPMASLLGEVIFETELDFAFDSTAVIAWFFVVLIISVLASVAPAFSATRISVRESLMYG